MAVIIAAVVPPALEFIKWMVDRFVPSHITRKREFKAKKRVINRLTTISEIARAGRRSGIV